MAEMTPHEKYMAGEPLNDELAALRDGREKGFYEQPAIPQNLRVITGGDVGRDLTKAERMALRDTRNGPGWPVLVRLLEKTSHIQEKSAIASSQTDPLGNKEAIANNWAYKAMFDRAQIELQMLVEAEVKQLEDSK